MCDTDLHNPTSPLLQTKTSCRLQVLLPTPRHEINNIQKNRAMRRRRGHRRCTVLLHQRRACRGARTIRKTRAYLEGLVGSMTRSPIRVEFDSVEKIIQFSRRNLEELYDPVSQKRKNASVRQHGGELEQSRGASWT